MMDSVCPLQLIKGWRPGTYMAHAAISVKYVGRGRNRCQGWRWRMRHSEAQKPLLVRPSSIALSVARAYPVGSRIDDRSSLNRPWGTVSHRMGEGLYDDSSVG
jgi:hypothetical protein